MPEANVLRIILFGCISRCRSLLKKSETIDDLFVETIEMLATAAFLPREEKMPFVRAAIRKVDAIKLLFSLLWETKTLDNKKYISLSVPLEEIGRMAGGWYGQLTKPVSSRVEKQNSSGKIPEEK
jgi:hypothetical protein